MSVTGARVEIVTALSTVPGVTGHSFRPKVLKAGSAWVLLDNLDRGPGNAFSGTWRVIVILGGEEKAAQSKLDSFLPLIVAAVESQNAGYVFAATPVAVQTSAGDVFAAEIFVRSE